MTNWKNLWSQRYANPEILDSKDRRDIFLELKRANGFDVLDGGLTYEALMEQYNQIKQRLFCPERYGEVTDKKLSEGGVYEVGCGSGANLYLFENEGIRCGGLDYSEQLVKSAKRILRTEDITCDEAVNLSTELKYDAVLANSVFSYFTDEIYARNVLEKMYKKANNVIGIIDIHDIEKKNDFISYRKKIVKDYEKRYENLPKFFYSKQFFVDFAESHNMAVAFTNSAIEGYWNNDFVFNCYMYK